MSWVEISKFKLIPSEMCAGQIDFKPYIPKCFQYGLQKGKYKIQYVSGAVRSHNAQRYKSILQNNIIFEYESKQYELKTTNGKQWIYNNDEVFINIIKEEYITNQNLKNNYINFCYLLTSSIPELHTVYLTEEFKNASKEQNLEFEKVNIYFKESFKLRWNKYYSFYQNNFKNLKNYNFSYFPQLKLNVFQCPYGTLPGFTNKGSATKELSQYYSTSDKFPKEIYQKIKKDIQPLEFEITKSSNISFWYTDDCAPCTQGSITYRLLVDTDAQTMPINGLSVISYDINTLQTSKAQYYSLQLKQATTLRNSPYKYQEKLLEVQNQTNHLLDLKTYNTIGYSKNTINSGSLYLIYKNNYIDKYFPNIYWKLTKRKTVNNFQLITKIEVDLDTNNVVNIPLFSGSYTLISSNSFKLQGFIIINDEVIQLNQKEEQVFYIQETTNVTFKTNAYLYFGQITQKYILEKINENINISLANLEEQEDIQAITKIYKDELNIINNDFYLYIEWNEEQNVGQIKILKNIIPSSNNIENIIGPFKTIQDATIQIKKYCILNKKQYQMINQITYSIGNIENNGD